MSWGQQRLTIGRVQRFSHHHAHWCSGELCIPNRNHHRHLHGDRCGWKQRSGAATGNRDRESSSASNGDAPANVSRNTGPGATSCGIVVSDAELGTASS